MCLQCTSPLRKPLKTNGKGNVAPRRPWQRSAQGPFPATLLPTLQEEYDHEMTQFYDIIGTFFHTHAERAVFKMEHTQTHTHTKFYHNHDNARRTWWSVFCIYILNLSSRSFFGVRPLEVQYSQTLRAAKSLASSPGLVAGSGRPGKGVGRLRSQDLPPMPTAAPAAVDVVVLSASAASGASSLKVLAVLSSARRKQPP